MKTAGSPFGDGLLEARAAMSACMQCGTCSASCPNAADMDMTPRRMWRLLVLGREDELMASRTFRLCSACYVCTLRCPRGLPLTETIYALKREAARRDPVHAAFYRSFVENARAWGRVQEGPLMARYLLARRSPAVALGFVPLGLRMLAKGRMHPPSARHKGALGPLFAAVRGGGSGKDEAKEVRS
ncbi:MAG: 4Fe-4S dicluster domain-containing protein [Desulfovibrionaceae bacterium]